jgi:hypothetical protein
MYALFRVIGRVREYPGEDSTPDPIGAQDFDSMLVSMEEILV